MRRRYSKSFFVIVLTLVSLTKCWANAQEEAAALLEQSVNLLAVEMASPRFEGVRNLVGASRAVMIIPSYRHGGLLLGFGGGKGIVLKRHGRHWSDPLFVSLSEIDLGLQIGFYQARALACVLTESAIDKIASGVAHWGTAGGISFLKWGVDASGTASWDSGLDSTVVALSRGLYIGGTFIRANIRPHDAFSQLYYGNKSAPSILATPGVHPAAARLRNIFHMMIEVIWEDQDKIGG